nr:hypothetical protein [Gammaproteobacteria bacterium]
AAYTIGNGLVLGALGETETSAGPLMATFAYTVFSTINGILYATGIKIGKVKGENEVDDNEALKVGQLVQQSWIIGTAFGIPALALLLNTGSFLKATGVDADIADAVQDYFTAISWGIFPIFWNFSDQQLTVGLEQPKVTLASGTMYSAMSAAFGYPLALGLWGLPKLGTAGIGYGASASAWLSLIGLRLYFSLNPDTYQSYGLYHFNFTGICQRLMEDLTVGVPIGVQNIAEWGNLAVLSVMSGNLGDDVLAAEQASIISISAFTVMILAFAQGVGVSISTCLGQAEAAVRAQYPHKAQTARENARLLGHMGTTMGLGIALCVCLVFLSIPKKVVSIFLDNDDDDTDDDFDDTQQLAAQMLMVNGIGLLPDTMGNMYGGALRGHENVVFAPVARFVGMSLIGLTLGATMTFAFDESAVWLFVSRDFGMLLAGLATAYYFHQTASAVVQLGGDVLQNPPPPGVELHQPVQGYDPRFLAAPNSGNRNGVNDAVVKVIADDDEERKAEFK